MFTLILRMNVNDFDKETRDFIKENLVIRVNDVEANRKPSVKDISIDGEDYF
jgi:hypothetical protein